MTWYADEILMQASDTALDVVRRSPFAPFAYHIKSVEQCPWYRPEAMHGLPAGGLVVVRPVCDASARSADWHEEETLDPRFILPNAEAEQRLSKTVTDALASEAYDDCRLPSHVRVAAAWLAIEIGQPVVYYSCSMWGGGIEHEYALIYSPDESLVRTVVPENDVRGVGDALCAGLSRIGLDLPSPFFAPHTRSFPWENHRLG